MVHDREGPVRLKWFCIEGSAAGALYGTIVYVAKCNLRRFDAEHSITVLAPPEAVAPGIPAMSD